MGPLAARPEVLAELNKLLRNMRRLLRAPLDPLTRRTVEDAIRAIHITKDRVRRATPRPSEFPNPWKVGVFRVGILKPKERA